MFSSIYNLTEALRFFSCFSHLTSSLLSALVKYEQYEEYKPIWLLTMNKMIWMKYLWTLTDSKQRLENLSIFFQICGNSSNSSRRIIIKTVVERKKNQNYFADLFNRFNLINYRNNKLNSNFIDITQLKKKLEKK